MEERLLEILTEVRPDIDFETETGLIDDNILESFDILDLVSKLNDEFDIEISPKYLVAENFNSMKAIGELVRSLMDEED